jgi:hypothetical protein
MQLVNTLFNICSVAVHNNENVLIANSQGVFDYDSQEEFMPHSTGFLETFGNKTICFKSTDGGSIHIIEESKKYTTFQGEFYYMTYYNDNSVNFYLAEIGPLKGLSYFKYDSLLNKKELFLSESLLKKLGIFKGKFRIIKTKEEVLCFDMNDESLLWHTNINAIPKKNIQPNPYTNELEEQPNRFAGQPNDSLFAYNEILFVHTEAALLAYEISTGKLLFDDIFNGYRFDLFDGKVYSIHKEGLFVSDAQTGRLLASTDDICYQRKEDVENKSSTVINRFITNIKVFDDYILCTDSAWGKIAFFDRKTLKRERVVDVSGINAKRDNIIWHENRLYIHGVGDVLFVYE